ncbi:MAG TPA: hypothetical protein PKC91_00935 [Ignavibacteria bacterium]|nr:hypothetical protein [Ignavibacteria bacterium]
MRKVLHKIKKQIEALSLNLSGKILLTEAATGPYIVTSITGALAGAKVFAYAKNSRYGSAMEVFEINRKILADLGTDIDINYIDRLDSNVISKADIITNSGHLRPVNMDLLKHIKKGCVIPLMYESWELRDSDLDLKYCKDKGIPVGATNERHPDINVFSYLGDMAVKQILDSGVCLYDNNFVLLCNNQFGPYIAQTLSRVCKNLGVIDKKENRKNYDSNIEWLSDFPEIKVTEKYKDCEAIIFTAYPFDKKWIGDETSVITAGTLMKEFNDPLILRYAGDIDTVVSDEKGLKYFPEKVQSGHMGVLPSDIGFDPVIRLQSGGLKAGELMLQGQTDYNGQLLVELL